MSGWGGGGGVGVGCRDSCPAAYNELLEPSFYRNQLVSVYNQTDFILPNSQFIYFQNSFSQPTVDTPYFIDVSDKSSCYLTHTHARAHTQAFYMERLTFTYLMFA